MLNSFQLDRLRRYKQQQVLDSSIYGNVKGESSSTDKEGGFLRCIIYCWAAVAQRYMVPTNRTQLRGVHFFLNLNGSKKTEWSFSTFSGPA